VTQLFSYNSREAYERDVETGLALLTGIWHRGKNGRYGVHFCSANTKPTEREARAALSRLLLVGELPDLLRVLLAILFTPELFGSDNAVQRKVVFKRLNTGHSNIMKDMIVASLVQHLRNIGHRYEKAIEKVGEGFKLDERHIKKIYGKHRGPLLNKVVDNVLHSIRHGLSVANSRHVASLLD
jgi:hypothetical protein